MRGERSRGGPRRATLLRWGVTAVLAAGAAVWWSMDTGPDAAGPDDELAADRLRLLTRACVAYLDEHGGEWPADYAAFPAETDGQPLRVLLTHPGCDEPLPHYFYLRPVPGPSVGQPLFVQKPACRDGDALLVAYVDGSTHRLHGAEADRVAERATALARRLRAGEREAVGAEDWEGLLAD